tara:strand:+ start:1020 stop:1391 length:372 start_codon:yes stop_codon:yes gene_type:complete
MEVMIFLIVILILFSPLILGLVFMGAQKRVNLKHKDSGLNKPGYVGYCWTYFFFSFFVPIFRGEILIGVLHLVFSIVTFGLFQLVIPFLYNKQFTSRLLTSGWTLSDTEENMQKARLKLGIGN